MSKQNQQEVFERLTALPRMIAALLHDIGNCNSAFYLCIPESGKIPSERKIETLEKASQQIQKCITKFGKYLPQFLFNEKTPDSLNTVLKELAGNSSWRWPSIQCQFDGPDQISINWLRLRQIVTPLLQLLHSLTPTGASQPLIISWAMKNETALLIRIEDPATQLDPDQFRALTTPYKNPGLQTDIDLDMMIASALNTGDGFTFWPNSTSAHTCLEIEVKLG